MHLFGFLSGLLCLALPGTDHSEASFPTELLSLPTSKKPGHHLGFNHDLHWLFRLLILCFTFIDQTLGFQTHNSLGPTHPLHLVFLTLMSLPPFSPAFLRLFREVSWSSISQNHQSYLCLFKDLSEALQWWEWITLALLKDQFYQWLEGVPVLTVLIGGLSVSKSASWVIHTTLFRTWTAVVISHRTSPVHVLLTAAKVFFICLFLWLCLFGSCTVKIFFILLK